MSNFERPKNVINGSLEISIFCVLLNGIVLERLNTMPEFIVIALSVITKEINL